MRNPLRPLVAALFAAIVAVPAIAAAVMIWPVDPILKPGERSTAIWLENKGEVPVTLQVRTFAWTQGVDGEQLAAQEAIVASPPIVTVDAGKRQLVRVVRRNPAAATAPETAYRLLIDELPGVAPGVAVQGATGRLAVQMRYSVPLFVYGAPPASLAPALSATIRPDGAGKAIEIRNTGALHARLNDLRIVANGRAQVVKPGLAGYILAGATMRFPLPAGAEGAVRAGVNGKDQLLTPGS